MADDQTIDELLEAQFAPAADEDGQPEPGQAATDEAQSGETEGGEADAPQPPPSPSTVRIGNRDVPVEDVEALLEFQSWAAQNADKMQAFGQYLQGEADFVQKTAQPPAPPDEDEWEDVPPAVRRRLEEYEQRIAELQQPLGSIQEAEQQRVIAAAQQAVDTGVERFKQQYELSDEEIQRLTEETAQLQILPQLRSQIPDPVQAVVAALEVGYWKSEEFRQKAVDRQVAQAQVDADRKRKAGQVFATGGSTGHGVGSTGKVSGEISEADRRTAMAAEIAEAIRGTP